MQKLYRSRTDRIVAGICGGLGNYLQLDASLIRFVLLLILIFTGVFPLLIAYLIAALIIPLEPAGMPIPIHRRLLRSTKHKMIAGICGGIAEAINTDPTLVRLVAVFLCFLTGVIPLLLAYLAAWIIVPKR